MTRGLANRYQILSQLARGGMGEILLARRLGPAGFEKLVVLKRPLPHLAGSGAVIESLVEEARLLARINHPNVCQVHDLEETDGQYYLALEYLEGLSLWTLVSAAERAGTAMDPRAVCGMIEQACDGLDAIHALRGKTGELAHVVHRDISPGNLMLTETGTLKILDLGIAKAADSVDLTPFGRVKGKLPYVSPEQAKGQPIDARADLFALGLVLYDLARGRRPGERIGAIACDSLAWDEIPPPIADVVRIAAASVPAARFATARDMGLAVRRAGAALGGSFERAALASWLASHHAADVEQRRAWLSGAIGDATASREISSETQILSMRSVLPDDDEPPPVLRSRETERLELPEHERIVVRQTERLELPEAERVVAGHGELADRERAPAVREQRSPPVIDVVPSRGRARKVALVVAGSVIAGIAVAIITSRGGDSSAADAAPPAAAVATSARSDSPPHADVPPRVESPPSVEAPPPAGSPAADASARADSASPADRPGPPAQHAPPRRDGARRVAKAEPGQLTIGSTPYATVRLGTRKLGTTPLYRIALPPGRYRLHAVTEDGRSQDVSVAIESGHERLVKLEWSGT